MWTAIVEQTPQVIGYDERHRPIKKRLRRQIYGKTKTAVMQRLAAMLRETGQAPRSKDRLLTLSEYLNRWLADVAVGSRATTHASYEIAVRKHIVPGLGATRMDKLTSEAMRAWITTLQKANVGARTLQLAFVVLKSALEDAIDGDVILKNPCRRIPRPKYEAEERVALGADELRRLIDAARGKRYEAAIVVAIGTGARQGEILGLRWRDVSIERAVMSIDMQLQDGKSVKLKTKASKRKITLPDLCVKAFENHARRMEAEGRKLEGFVFVGETGRPLDRHNFVKRAFAPVAKAAGLEGATFHQLRHSWATLQSELGIMPARDLSAMLGHSRTSTTMDVYTHQATEAQRRGSEALDRLLKGKASR